MASNANNAHPVVPEGFLVCGTCKAQIKVGSGGVANLQENHEGKPKCLARKRENDLVEKFGPKPVKKKPVFAPLNSYFFKPKQIVPSKVAAPPSLHGTPVTPADPRSIPDAHVAEADYHIPSVPPAVSTEAQDLLVGLWAKMELIPSHAPHANSTHPLAEFSFDPQADVSLMQQTYDDDWAEHLEPMFKRAFGWGEFDAKYLMNLARRGRYGLDGLHQFLCYFVERRGLLGVRIQEYVAALMSAIEMRFPSANSAAVRTGAKSVADTEIIRLPPMSEDFHAPVLDDLRPCVGIEIRFPVGKSHHSDYPFGLHRQYSLPWDYYSKGDRFFIQAQACARGLCPVGNTCVHCTRILSHTVLKGIFQRLQSGVPEHTPYSFMPSSVLIDLLRRKSDLYRGLKLTRLNDLRALTSKTGSSTNTNIAQLVRACLNNHVGIRGLVERYQRACQDLYSPKGFSEDDVMLGLLVLRLGGARLAGIVHRAIGLPGISTLRTHTIIRPLRPSPAMPTRAEIEANIDACAEAEPESTGPPIIIHRVLMLDEIALQPRPRWDDRTNMILGACREHAHKVSLELNTAADLESEESMPLSEGDDFGPEITQPDSPGPIPASYPDEDDETIEYLDGSEIPEARQMEIATLETELQHPEIENHPPTDPAALLPVET
ncbi:hypothetical protein C8R46DRAFT_1270144 [Mycena filopes]|nr:hypothetical protein C8R46DRAFT_1270144 [Mycena filopes]